VYYQAFLSLEQAGTLRWPMVPPECAHNAHMYYLLPPDLAHRTAFIDDMRQKNIAIVFHYVPLHRSPAGEKFGRSHGTLPVTVDLADRLVRLSL
jgi:dTDP-4-amino-4,6-dideoxygalactose transaminase